MALLSRGSHPDCRWLLIQIDALQFSQGHPTVAMPPDSVSINPVQPDDDDPAAYSVVNFPTLSAARHTAAKSTLIFNDLYESG
jgi:putative transposase